MKKLLSLVLVIGMTLSSMSTAFAATFSDLEDNSYEKAIETLTALGVVTGYEDGTYRPENVVTRAEMAKLMVELLGYGDLVSGSKSNFSDTQGHWADQWIALAAGNGIVIGTGNGQFSPEKTVTYDEVLTMLVRGLGYTDDCNELKGTWPTNFKVKSAEIGITKNVKMASTGADRGGVAQAMYNSLEATLVTVDKDKNVQRIVDSKNNGRPLLSRLATLDEEYEVTSEKLDPTNKKYASGLMDLSPYMYQTIEAYLVDKDGKDHVVYVKDAKETIIEGSYDDITYENGYATVEIEKADGAIEKVEIKANNDSTTSKVTEDSIVKENVYINRGVGSSVTLKDIENADKIIVVKDGKTIKGIVLTTPTEVAKIENVYEDGDKYLDVFDLPTTGSKVDLSKIVVKGEVSELKDIQEDDVVTAYIAGDENFITLDVTRKTVEGSITRESGSDKYIDGTKYKVSPVEGAVDKTEIAVGDEGIFYLDNKGKIAFVDTEVGEVSYGLVIGQGNGEIDDDLGSKSIDKYPRIKLLNKSGNEVTYDVNVKLNSDGNKVTKNPSGNVKYEVNSAGDSIVTTNANLKKEAVVEYKINSDNKITSIKVVDTQTKDIDTSKSSFKLAKDAFVVTTDGEIKTISSSKLPGTVQNAKVIYNKNGEIAVLVTNKAVEAKYTFAYVTNVGRGDNPDGDTVQIITAYVDGEKKELFTDAEGIVNDGTKKVYALEINKNVIEEATTSSAVESGLTPLTGIDSVGSDSIKINGNWVPVSEKVTILQLTSSGSVDSIKKLSSVSSAKNRSKVYVYDGEVVLVTIDAK